MEQVYTFNFLDQDLLLLPERAIFWKNKNTILAADLHLGKAGHFRKAGIPFPSTGINEDYKTISDLINKYKAEKFLILGDLFHSEHNAELELFGTWKAKHPNLEVVLIKGNHDILSPDFYTQSHIKTVDEVLEHPPFILSHKLLKSSKTKKLYNLAGHIHPAVELQGRARQQLTLSCFYFGSHYGLLPAFGKFTGKCKVQVHEGDHVFGILEDKVWKMR